MMNDWVLEFKNPKMPLLRERMAFGAEIRLLGLKPPKIAFGSGIKTAKEGEDD